MRKLAWQKLAPLLLCGLIATGCDQDKNSLTEPINWQSMLSESWADLDLENYHLDQLLGILNSLSLFPEDIIRIDENCLAEIGDISSFLASNRSVTCQLQLSNGEWVSVVVNRDLFGLDNIPNNNLQSGPSFTFNLPGETTTNPDPEIRNPVGENWGSVETMTGNWGSIDNWGSAGVTVNLGSIDNWGNWGSAGVMGSIGNWGSAEVTVNLGLYYNRGSAGVTVNGVSAGVIDYYYSGISTSPILFDPFNPGQPVNVSESNSIASLGFFGILLFGQRTFQYFRRQYQAKKVKK